MAWLSENKYMLSGNIDTGLTLNNSNPNAGTPVSGTPLFGSGLYGSQLYQYAASYQGTYESAYYNNKLTISTSGGSGDITYSYCLSDDNITYTSFSTPVNVVGTTVLYMKAKYFKLRIYYHSTLWGDSDSFAITNIEAYFTVFQPDTIIDANEMNADFQWVGDGTWYPLGATTLSRTSGSYNIGSLTYKWNNVYLDELNDFSYIQNAFVLLSQVNLTSAATTLEISGLNGYEQERYNIKIFIVNSVGHSEQYRLYFNGVSSASIYYGNRYLYSGNTFTDFFQTSGGIILSNSGAATSGTKYSFNDISFYFKNGTYYNMFSQMVDHSNSYISLHEKNMYYMTVASFGTITSLKIVAPTTSGLGVGTKIQIWAAR